MAIVGDQPIEVIPSKEDWQYKFLPILTSGIDTNLRDDTLKDDQLVTAENVRLNKGNLVTELGYVTFGVTIRGFPQATYQFERVNGTSILTLITTEAFYRWDATASEWQYVSNGTSTTLSGNEASGQTVLSMTSVAGFQVNEYVGITLDDGTQHQAQIDAVGGADITIDVALPSAAASGNAVVEAVLLTGDLDDPISAETLPPQDVMLFTNNSEKPQVYNGTTCIDMTGLPAGLTTAKFLGVYLNYVLLMNTVEGGTSYPQRVRNSDTGNHNQWVTGNANSRDLYSNAQHIVGYAELGEIRVIYKSNSIIRVSYVGSDAKLFQFDDVVEGEGALNHASIVSLRDKNIFVGNTNVWEYKGGFSLTPIGDEVFHLIFSSEGSLNPSARSRVFLTYVKELKEIWLFYPSGSDTDPQNSARYSMLNGSWHTRTWPVAINGHGIFQADSSVTWTASTGTWTDHSEAWNSLTILSNAPTIQLCGNDKQVYEYNFTASNDDGTDITFTVDTKDFFVPNRELRFDRFETKIKGTSVQVLYSINEGLTWTPLKTFTPGASFTRVRTSKQFVFRTIRFRLTGVAGGFAVRWLSFRYKQESIW